MRSSVILNPAKSTSHCENLNFFGFNMIAAFPTVVRKSIVRHNVPLSSPCRKLYHPKSFLSLGSRLRLYIAPVIPILWWDKALREPLVMPSAPWCKKVVKFRSDSRRGTLLHASVTVFHVVLAPIWQHEKEIPNCVSLFYSAFLEGRGPQCVWVILN